MDRLTNREILHIQKLCLYISVSILIIYVNYMSNMIWYDWKCFRPSISSLSCCTHVEMIPLDSGHTKKFQKQFALKLHQTPCQFCTKKHRSWVSIKQVSHWSSVQMRHSSQRVRNRQPTSIHEGKAGHCSSDGSGDLNALILVLSTIYVPSGCELQSTLQLGS